MLVINLFLLNLSFKVIISLYSIRMDHHMLKTERCHLYHFKKEHIEDVERLYTDKHVRKYLGGVRPKEDIHRSLQKLTDPSTNDLYWTVYDFRSNQFIGFVSITPHHNGDDLEISYQFSPNIWGRGYATEVIHQLINFGFSTLQITKLVAETQTANIASCKLLEKVGMHVEHVVTRFGNEQAIYAIFKKRQSLNTYYEIH